MAFNYVTTYNKILHGPLLICKKFFFFMNVTDGVNNICLLILLTMPSHIKGACL